MANGHALVSTIEINPSMKEKRIISFLSDVGSSRRLLLRLSKLRSGKLLSIIDNFDSLFFNGSLDVIFTILLYSCKVVFLADMFDKNKLLTFPFLTKPKRRRVGSIIDIILVLFKYQPILIKIETDILADSTLYTELPRRSHFYSEKCTCVFSITIILKQILKKGSLKKNCKPWSLIIVVSMRH